MKKTLIFFWISSFTLIFSGCSGKQVLKQNQLVENKHFFINWNTQTWDLNKEETSSHILLSKGYHSKGAQNINISVKYKNYNGNIDISSYPYNNSYSFNEGAYYMPNAEIFFDKNANYKLLKRELDDTPSMITVRHYGKRVYFKKFENINYINGMKCMESSVWRKTFRKKYYYITCGYYKLNFDNNDKQILRISYNYDNSSKPNGNLANNTFEVLLKQAVKQIISTLKIKNFDRERMEKEGLMHYDKEFESTKW